MTVSRAKLVGIALVIFAATVWLYWPSVHGDFLGGDDREDLRQSVRWHGLTWNAVKWAFTSTDDYYRPLPRLSHVLDYQIWGRNAAGHHATSVFLHALNAALVFGLLWTLLGAASLTIGERFMVALWVAVVFAIHPLQVESVAWIACRVGIMCATFGIGCVWAYVSGARRWVVWGLFLAALLCKPIAVSLPFVLLVADYFPLQRYQQLGWGRLIRDKAVLIALAAAVGLATMITVSREGAMVPLIPLKTLPLMQHVLLMFQSLVFYPWKLVWPEHLSSYYPLHLGLSLDQWPVLASVLCVGMITGLVLRAWRRLPALAAGWGAYVTLVLPMSGLVQRGMGAVALRYAYGAILPLLLVVGGGAVWAWRRSRTIARVALIGLLGCELWVFGMRTRSLIPIWHNDETWWRAPVEEFPDSELPNLCLAEALSAQGRTSEALEYAQRAVEIAPQLGWIRIGLGDVLFQAGKAQEAIAQYEQALRINPEDAGAHNNLGIALARTGKIEEAIAHYQQALRSKPDYADAHNNLGNIFLQEGKISDAIGHYEQALRSKPDSAEAHNNWGVALARTGKIEKAIVHFEQALRSKPDYAEAHANLGNALAQVGRVPEAIVQYEQALRIKPDYAQPRNALARLQARQ